VHCTVRERVPAKPHAVLHAVHAPVRHVKRLATTELTYAPVDRSWFSIEMSQWLASSEPSTPAVLPIAWMRPVLWDRGETSAI
jgi:hypothetical protein